MATIYTVDTMPYSEIQEKIKGLGTLSNKNIVEKSDLANDIQTSLDNVDSALEALQSFIETDPTVPEWAKAETKPSYTADEVGALPADTLIPNALSELTDDDSHRLVTDEEKALWNAKSDFSGSYNDLTDAPTNVSAFANDAEYVTEAELTSKGYLTEHQDISGKADKEHTHNLSDIADYVEPTFQSIIDVEELPGNSTPTNIVILESQQNEANDFYATMTFVPHQSGYFTVKASSDISQIDFNKLFLNGEFVTAVGDEAIELVGGETYTFEVGVVDAVTANITLIITCPYIVPAEPIEVTWDTNALYRIKSSGSVDTYSVMSIDTELVTTKNTIEGIPVSTYVVDTLPEIGAPFMEFDADGNPIQGSFYYQTSDKKGYVYVTPEIDPGLANQWIPFEDFMGAPMTLVESEDQIPEVPGVYVVIQEASVSETLYHYTNKWVPVGGTITTDSELNGTSENPVQNKVVSAKFSEIDNFILDVFCTNGNAGLKYDLYDNYASCIGQAVSAMGTNIKIGSIIKGLPVTSIGDSAFSGCSSLTSVVIPDSVTSIGDYAFAGCTSLTSVTIGSGVTNISEYAFAHCTALEEIYFNAIAMERLSNEFPFVNAGKNSRGIKLVIGDGVTIIPERLFTCDVSDSLDKQYAPNLTSVIIPDSVMFIGRSAFGRAENMNIYYKGTEEQWNAITIQGNPLTNATIHYNWEV